MLLLLLLALHGAAAVAAPPLVRRWGRRAFVPLAVPPAATLGWLLALAPQALAGPGWEYARPWIPDYGVELAFRVDALGWVLAVIATGVGALVLLYCVWYFDDAEPGLGRFAGVLTAFAGSMTGLVLADDVIVLYLFWELTTVFSYLLIGHHTESRTSRRAAAQAVLITVLGGLAMLMGLVMLAGQAGSNRITRILAAAADGSIDPSAPATVAAVMLVLAGCLTKSAQLPFHFWLPGAMAAPTPTSAYLHAAAMVKAGVYLVARLAPGFATVPGWRPVLVGLGLATMLFGGWRAMRQYDLKLLLAYGTVSQLGFLTLLFALGTRTAALAGTAMLVAHALFKSCLFLVVGVIDHATGTRDLRRLSGLHRSMPVLAGTALLAAASMAGLPPLLGFVGKESAFAALAETGGTGPSALLTGVVAGSVLTFGYSARFVVGAFATKLAASPTPVHRPAPGFVAGPLLLALLGLAGGLDAGTVGVPAERYAQGLAAPAGHLEPHLALWHGWGAPLVLSAVTVACGVGLFTLRHRFSRMQARLSPESFGRRPLDAPRVFRAVVRGLYTVAVRVTAATQRGSLPVYLSTILVVLLASALTVLGVQAGETGTGPAAAPGRPVLHWFDEPAQIAAVCVLTAGALGAVLAGRRLTAAILVGITGYATATLFLLGGAPDLALTQVLVETTTLVVFVLVFRRMPGAWSGRRTRPASRVAHALLAVGSSAVLVATVVTMLSARRADPASLLFPDAAREAGGANVINVTLVEMRAWDTMGEISVLLVAATGVTSLVFLRRRVGRLERVPLEPAPQVWRGSDDAGRRAEEVDRAAEAARRAWSGRDLARRARAARSVGMPEAESVTEAVAGRGRPAVPRSWLRAGRTLAPERRSALFEMTARILFHTMVLVSLFFLFSGENNVGGGFAGGMVAGLALVVRYLAGGRFELGEAAPVRAGTLLGIGLTLATGTALAGILLGGHALSAAHWHGHLPLLGEVAVTTSLAFDAGVYLVVVGLVLDLLRGFGAELDVQIQRAQAQGSAEAREEVVP